MDSKQRAVVLDFLCHSSYTNTARAFSRECTVRNVSVDADGDEIMSGDEKGELVSEEDAGLILSEETLKQVELRKGEARILDAQGFPSEYSLYGVRCQKFVIRFFPGEWAKQWISSIPISRRS